MYRSKINSACSLFSKFFLNVKAFEVTYRSVGPGVKMCYMISSEMKYLLHMSL